MASQRLTEADIEILTREVPLEVRESLATKVSRKYHAKKLNQNEQRIAEQIFRLLAHDAEVAVRKQLSENLKNDPTLPRDVAIKLASDVADVAVPMLSCSEVLTEDDLVEIVQSSTELACKVAVAQRKDLTEKLSDTLVNTGEPVVVSTLVGNQGARMAQATIYRILDKFSEHDSVLEGLVKRGGLPVAIAERMVSMVSDELKKTLEKEYNIAQPATVSQAVDTSREWVTLGLVEPGTEVDIGELVESLYRSRKLTPSIIIRALCMGNLRFFEFAMARLASIPVDNARKLISDRGPLGFKALYKAAGMPGAVYEAVKVVLDIAREETHEGKMWSVGLYNRMIERILTGGYDSEVENMSFLMAIIGGNIRSSGRAYAS